MTADEDHTKQVILHLSGQWHVRTRRGLQGRFPVLVEDAAAALMRSQLPNQGVVRHRKQPRRRRFGAPAKGPRLQRSQQGKLHRILDGIEVLHPDPAHQARHQLAVLMTEEVLDQLRGAQGVRISPTSTPEPGQVASSGGLKVGQCSITQDT